MTSIDETGKVPPRRSAEFASSAAAADFRNRAGRVARVATAVVMRDRRVGFMVVARGCIGSSSVAAHEFSGNESEARFCVNRRRDLDSRIWGFRTRSHPPPGRRLGSD